MDTNKQEKDAIDELAQRREDKDRTAFVMGMHVLSRAPDAPGELEAWWKFLRRQDREWALRVLADTSQHYDDDLLHPPEPIIGDRVAWGLARLRTEDGRRSVVGARAAMGRMRQFLAPLFDPPPATR